jgi:hypothetical protein
MEVEMGRKPSIPRSVLEKIVAHRPHLKTIVDNIPKDPDQIERALTDAYLQGESQLTGPETFALSSCCVGRPYGQLANGQKAKETKE